MNPNETLVDEATASGFTGAQWVSVAAAAARLGVSTKTLRKRIASGEIQSRRVAQKRGGIAYQVALDMEAKWKRNGSEVETEVEAKRKRSGSQILDLKPIEPIEAENWHPEVETETEAKWKRSGSEVEVVLLRESLAREREMSNAFREQLLDANRNAAELRAALRKALDAAPKQLTASNGDAEMAGASSTNQTTSQSARTQPGAPQAFVDERETVMVNGRQSAPRLPETVTYASILAELEKEMNP